MSAHVQRLDMTCSAADMVHVWVHIWHMLYLLLSRAAGVSRVRAHRIDPRFGHADRIHVARDPLGRPSLGRHWAVLCPRSSRAS